MNGLCNNIKTFFTKTKAKSKSVVSSIEFVPTHYPSDLTDKQWEVIEKYFKYGNQSKLHKRSLVNAILYIVKTGCQWRMLPHDYPHWSAVWSFYNRAKNNGLWLQLMDELVKITREDAGKEATPTYALIDSQSVKTTSASEERGIDGGKKIKGRKRHIVVDTLNYFLCKQN